ncbi:hypothetical protein TNCV_3793731 [Trichonephila clavipes]|nr:hypothetical protein TNCV_3793731 [Trichonephila clavipes]
MYLCILSLYVIRRGRLPGHDGRCRVGYVQWTTSPPVLRVEQSTLTSHPVRNARLKRDTGKYVDGSRFNETFPQAELRRLEQAKRDTAHRAADTPERSQVDVRQNIWHLNGLLNSPKLGVFSMQLTWRLREIQKALKQLNLANVLLLKGHNSDV